MYIHVPTPPPGPSLEARELGEQIAELVRMHREEHPELDASDVTKALTLAHRTLAREIGGAASLAPKLTAVMLGLSALVAGGVFFAMQSPGAGGTGGPGVTPLLPAIGVIGVIVVLAAMLVARKNQ